jgi:phage gpG-like protein
MKLDATNPTRLPDGRLLRPGQEVSINGLPGRYTWVGTIAADGSLHLFGGKPSRERARCIMPDRVKIVHRTQKRRAA